MSSAPRPVLLKFTPSAQTPAILERLTVQRGDLIASLVEDVFGPDGSQSHRLLVGSRGLGKSHVIAVLNNRAASDPRADSVRIAMLDEDHWRRRTYEKFLVDVARALKLPAQDSPITTEDRLRSAGEAHRIVILVENLDELFRKIGADGQRRFRALLESSRQILVIATTPRLFTGVQSHSAPFYGFFQTTFLDELTLDSALDLLRAVAEITHDDALAAFLETDLARRRLKVVETLAGGHPRIWMLLAGCVSVEWIDDLVPLFLETVDELTAYYQSRLAELGDQSQELVALVAEAPGAISGRDLAQQADLSPNRVATAMADLEQRGYVRRATIEGLPSKGDRRLVYWELREPLMRLCLEIKSSQGRPLRLIVRFLRAWFEQELPAQLDRLPESAVLARSYLEAALEPDDELAEVAQRTAVELEATEPADRSRAFELTLEAFQLFSDGRQDAAAERFKKALELDDKAAYAVFGLATILILSGDFPAGLEMANRAVAIDPENPQLLGLRGLALVRLGEAAAAIEDLERAVELEPQGASFHSVLGDALTAASRTSDAVAAYARAANLDPTSGSRAAELARALAKADAPLEETVAAFANAWGLGSPTVGLAADYAAALLGSGQPAPALEILDESLVENPDSIRLLGLRAQASIALGDLEEAAAALDEGERIRADDALLIFFRTQWLVASDRLKEAADKVEELASRDFDNAAVCVLTAVVRERLGEHVLAAEAAERLTVLRPEEEWGWNRLARNRWLAGDADRAARAAERAMAVGPRALRMRLLAAVARGQRASDDQLPRFADAEAGENPAALASLWRDVWRIRPTALPILIDAYARAGATDEAAQILTSMIPTIVSQPAAIETLLGALENIDDYEIVDRLIRAAVAWTSDHDSRHLLDLPREEREILTGLLVADPDADE